MYNYGEALIIEPQNISLKLKFAELLIRKKEYRKALILNEELLEKTVKLKPNGKHYFNYALVLSKNERWDEALRNMNMDLNNHETELTDSQIEMAEKAVSIWKKQFN